MDSDWKESRYHGFTILSRVVPPSGDYSRWVAEVLLDDKELFKLRLTISGTILRREEDLEYLKNEGLKRVHARIDFGEITPNELYEHEVSTRGETVSHPINEPYRELFSSNDERLIYHILQTLKRTQYTTPGHVISSDYDLSGWAYYFGIVEDEIIPVLHRLDQEGAIKVFWTPNPKRTNSFIPDGGLAITAIGERHLSELELHFVNRVRETVMADLEENAFQISRVLYENQFYGSRMIEIVELRKLIPLDASNFNTADMFLLQSQYCEGAGAGDTGVRSLKPDGVKFVKAKLSERFELSFTAEFLARYLFEKQMKGRSFISGGQIQKDLAWGNDQLNQYGQELIDEGLTEEKPKIDQAAIGGLGLTNEGRRAVRKNFRKATPPISQQVSQHYGDQISISNVGEGAAVAAGRGATATQGLSGQEIVELFQPIYKKIESLENIAPKIRDEIKENVELIEEEVNMGEQANEKATKLYFRNLMKMAPDIFDVVIAKIINPVNGLATAIKKIAEKAKQEAQKED